MSAKMIERLPKAAALLLVVLLVAACAIRLRGDVDQVSSPAAIDQPVDPLAAKLAQCRSVAYDQKDALAECRQAWAEKRQQFLGLRARPGPPDSDPLKDGSSLFVRPKDDSRFPAGLSPTQQSRE